MNPSSCSLLAMGRNLALLSKGPVESMIFFSGNTKPTESKALRKASARMKGDERILGDGDFVEKVLKGAEEKLERKYKFEAEGYDFDWVVRRVAQLLGMELRDVLAHGKYRQTVKARSLVCYWCHRELGMTTVKLAKKLKLSQPTVSESAMRGQRTAAEEGLSLLEKIKL